MMKEKPYVVLDQSGIVLEAATTASGLLGIPMEEIVQHPLLDRMIPEHRVRFTAEIEALINRDERHGRVHCTFIGLDGIGRRLTLLLNITDQGRFHVALSRYQHPESTGHPVGSALVDSGHLLPVTRRISAISRRATTKEELLSKGLEVFVEITSASAGAILEWEDMRRDGPIITVGPFNPAILRGIFRPAVIARLTRGDVVIKEATVDGTESDICLIIVPLLSGTAPQGIIVLSASGYSVLVPEEQQSLAILGEILGLGLKALFAAIGRDKKPASHRGDIAASIALGRLSAGLAHEINNSTTVLRNNLEQFVLRSNGYGYGVFDDYAVKDSMNALSTICDLSDALRAFAPEETHSFEPIDLIRVVDMVVRSMRFYAKRGMNIVLKRPDGVLPFVRIRSHYLMRSLFLVLVDLAEASIESGIDLDLRLAIFAKDDYVILTITVTAGPFSLPTVLLAQLEKDGALTRHIARAGGKLTHAVDHQGNLDITVTLPSVRRAAPHTPPPPSVRPDRRGRILIADDEIAIIRSMRRLLEKNHDVLAARSGEEAIELIKSTPQIDIILYDVSMPRLGGQEFFDELSRLQLPAVESIIFVSGGVTDAEVARFLADTSNPVIEKPFDLMKLNELIAGMLA
ncbi:MAG: response regulator [Myxococcota bacterium]|nr:response regulator [Myxococcota bacterium]